MSRWLSPQEGEDAEIEVEADEPFDVEKLLRWRWIGPSGRRHKEFLVLWIGWSIDNASWVLAGNFTYARELQKMIKRGKLEEATSMG